MQYKNFEVNDELIDQYVDKLDCSIAEACEAILCDQGQLESQEQKELDRAATGKVGKIVGAATGSRPNRGKKAPNMDKKRIIRIISDALYEISTDIEVENDEKYIKLRYNDADYVINLTKTRKKG